MSWLVWKKNKFLESESRGALEEPLSTLDISLEDDFMNEHGSVLVNAFNEYLADC